MFHFDLLQYTLVSLFCFVWFCASTSLTRESRQILCYFYFLALLSSVKIVKSNYLILGVELNTVLNPTLDKSNPKDPTPTKMTEALLESMFQYGLVDLWRHLHPVDKQFLFYSHVHKSHLRTHNFVIDKDLLPLVTTTE